MEFRWMKSRPMAGMYGYTRCQKFLGKGELFLQQERFQSQE
jgi:hypothetical protein